MTLIERLRELGFSGNELGHEAADEIENLQALVENLEKICAGYADKYKRLREQIESIQL